MNPNLPVGGSASDVELGITGLPEDVTQLALVMQYGHYARTLEGDAVVDDPNGTLLQLLIGTLLARHHFGEGWSAELAVPMGFIEIHTHDVGAAPGALVPLHAGEASAVDSRIAGFGDVMLGGRYDFAALWGAGAYRPSLTLGLGLGFPTAEQITVAPDPSVPPTLLALGNATWSLAPSLALTQFVHPDVAIALPVGLRVPITRAENARRPGIAFDAALALLYRPIDALTLRAGVAYEAMGHADEPPEGLILNSGGSWLRASGGATVRVGESFSLGAGVRVPFYAQVHGRQLAESWTVDATAAVVFGAGARDDDHGHDDHDHDHDDHDHDRGHGGDDHEDHGHDHDDHGHDHDAEHPAAARGDVADLARGGASFALADAGVPGKITVVDFWATWCGPCVEVGATLDRLAADHPDLAVRKAEIIDFEEPIGREHFGGEGALPHLWILDREGVIVERFTSSSPREVRRRVLRHLTR